METVLEIKGLCKSYGDFELRNLNLSLEKGTLTGFIGPNGAGKTTTIKSISVSYTHLTLRTKA